MNIIPEVLAQDPQPPDPASTAAGITNPALGKTLSDILSRENPGSAFLQQLLPNLIGLGFIVGVVLFVFYLLWGAIGWIVSGGDKAAIESARGKVVNAVVGLIILFSIFAVIKLIEAFFGVNILVLDIGILKIQ